LLGLKFTSIFAAVESKALEIFRSYICPKMESLFGVPGQRIVFEYSVDLFSGCLMSAME